MAGPSPGSEAPHTGAARPPVGQRFPRALSLKRRRLIRPLFARGRSDVFEVSAGVVKALCRFAPRADVGSSVPYQAGFAPGRRARTNAGRTHLRRLMRETFRVHQQPLVDLLLDRARTREAAAPADPEVLTIMLLFRGRESTASADLRRDVPRVIGRLLRRLDPPTGSPDGQAAVNPER